MEKTITVFTPTFNRLRTLKRTFSSLLRQSCQDFDWLVVDDGSNDGTNAWVESLGEKSILDGVAYDWMGCPVRCDDKAHFRVETESKNGSLSIEYIYKPNGGLYTGYNVAFSAIQTELCVCVDSDDYLPDNAIEIIINKWMSLSETEKQQVGGIVGLDYNVANKLPIGGEFKTDKNIEWIHNLHHTGDTKYVFRTELMRKFAPQIGFKGERDFNPHYMQMQMLDQFPMVVLNENLCWVEYQIGADSMSQAIFKQYVRSPKSYAKYRIMEMKMRHGNGVLNRLRLCSHYVSACIFAQDRDCLKNSPYKSLTIAAMPIGLLLNLYIRLKARH